jgi:hypothetical protein
MQAERKDKVIEFRCQRCDASVIVAPTGKNGEGVEGRSQKPTH